LAASWTARALAGAVVSKPTAKKTTRRSGCRRASSSDAHVAALRLHRQQVLTRARHAQHVAEGAEGEARARRERERAVDHLERRDADGAAGSVDELHARRQQSVQAELEDGVGLAATDLHERPGSARGFVQLAQ